MITLETFRDALSRTSTQAVSLAAALSQPRTDVDASDAAFEAVLRDSAIVRSARAAADVVRAAWHGSVSRTMLSRPVGEVAALGSAARLRAISWTATVASLSALVLDAIRPTPIGPFSWLLPAICAALSIAAWCAAGPLARARGARRT